MIFKFSTRYLIFFITYCLIWLNHNCVARTLHKFAKKPFEKFHLKTSCPYGYSGTNCEDECGITYSPSNTRIVGGSVVHQNSWPAQAYILFRYTKLLYVPLYGFSEPIAAESICGGTLIDRETVITAAHCIPQDIEFNLLTLTQTEEVEFNSYNPTLESMLTVFLGVQSLDNLNSSSVHNISVSKVIIHEEFSIDDLVNDIAILKLSKKVELNRNVQIACLPKSDIGDFPIEKSRGWAVGWGSTKAEGYISNQLRNVKLNVYNQDNCKSVAPYASKNWDLQLCVGDLAGGRDTCQGDSGGPLYVQGPVNNKLKYILSGIVSYGDGCGVAGKPGIYTRISSYLNWIQDNI